jgi:flagellar hook-associated protein 1 FlgK
MSLSTALSIAQTALLNTSRQTTVVSRNISEGNNTDYTRRSAVLVSSDNGARVVSISRATNDVLFRQNMSAISAYSGQSAVVNGLDQLSMDVYGVEHSSSPATVIGQFQEALQTYSANPSSISVGQNAIEAARQVVNSLNDGSDAIQAFRSDLDRQIGSAVGELNSLLSDFKKFNDEVVSGTRVGRDVNDALDQRDAVLKKISEYVPVTAIQRSDNDMMLVTKSGATLFETNPREVTFAPTAGYSPGADGNAVYIDGEPIASGVGGNTSAGGKLAAMTQMRDDVAGGMQAQLDEIARGLITAFAEKDPSAVNPDAPGLFTWPGAPAVPAAGTLVDGLAQVISINAAFDPTQGGDVRLLRDGGANGAAYVSNPTGGAAYTDLLLSYQQRMEEPMAFDPAAGIDGTMSVADYSTETISSFESIRQDASRASDAKSAMLSRTQEALSNMTGVNMDEEMTLMLDLEHTYQASARLMRTVDDMLSTLLQAMR